MRKKIEYEGLWFLPGNKEKQIYGTLTFDPKDDIVLELLGRLEERNENRKYHEQDFVLGLSKEGKVITLYKAFESSRSVSSPGIETSTYSALYLIIGDHFETETEFRFTKITGRFKNLDSWISKYGFTNVALDPKNNKVDISYQSPLAINFRLNENLTGALKFTFSSPRSKQIQYATIKQRAQIYFESFSPKPFFEILDDLMLFQNFLTLGTFEPTYPLAITLTNKERTELIGAKTYDKVVEVLFVPGFKFSSVKRRSTWEFLFNFQDIENNFENLLKNWYSQNANIEPVTNLLFESFYQRGRFTENSFLNIVRALETFHRRFRKNEVLPKLDHKKKIEEILNSAPSIHQSWLEERLNFSNEPTLRQRLFELVNEVSSKIITSVIGDKVQLIKDAKNSRNYYTHYELTIKNKALKHQQLFILTEKLRIILIVVILQETGFTQEQVEKLFERNEYKFFNHLMNSKSGED